MRTYLEFRTTIFTEYIEYKFEISKCSNRKIRTVFDSTKFFWYPNYICTEFDNCRIETTASCLKFDDHIFYVPVNIDRNPRFKWRKHDLSYLAWLEWQYDFLGEKQVKNISRPIRVYNLLMKPESSSDVASKERMAFPPPDKPSIAVLPFDNMSGNPEQEYIGDGISENIISALMSIVWGWSKSSLEDFKRCEELTQKAKELDENLSHGYAAAALLHLLKLDHKKSIEEAKMAITLGPNDPWNYAISAFAKYFNGNFQEAFSLSEKIERLSPYRPSIYLMATGLSYRGAGKYDEAVAIFNDLFDRAQRGEFNLLIAHQYLTPTYAMQGNMSKARYHAAELLKIKPDYSLEYYRTASPFKNPKHFEPIFDAFRKAGIPDTPSKSDSI